MCKNAEYREPNEAGPVRRKKRGISLQVRRGFLMFGARVFRIFISSTFTDMAAERNALQERVFGELKAHCAKKGFGFQPVDLRWGISSEASAGQRTMRICLSEIARCQAVTPRPNFVVLLGNRYGWRPLPELVDAEEFDRVTAKLAADDAAVARRAHHRDENAVPPEYVLAPMRADDPYDADTLRAALETAAREAGLSEDAVVKYTASATEQEILEGALQVEDSDQHVFCFSRSLSGLPDRIPAFDPKQLKFDENVSGNEPVFFKDFVPNGSPDTDAAEHLSDLKARLREKLGGHFFECEARWTDSGVTTDHVDKLCNDLLESLKSVIDAEIDRLGDADTLAVERQAHEEFAKERAECFVGRTSYLDLIEGYLAGEASHPLCIFSEGGLGKSALVATAAARARAAHHDALLLARYLGVTSTSAEPRSLLQNLCAEIGEAYGSSEPVPSTMQELQQEFPTRLALATAEKPLVIFLDSLDQLAAGSGASVSWLPADLPEHVWLVTTTRPGQRLDGLRGRLPEDNVVELGPMPPGEGREALDAWLAKDHRTLRPGQRAEVLDRFQSNGSPLYLRLAFEEAKQWTDQVEDVHLGGDVPSIIGNLYDRLAKEHGTELVGHSLGFLAAAYERLGLSEDELLEALAGDKDTWAEFTAGAKWEMPVRQLPVVVWSRVYFDLAPYVSPRASEGASLLSFFHKELADVARERYVDGRAAELHGVLADVIKKLAGATDEKTGDWEWNGSAHALAELPFHLTRAERWDDVFATLTDFTYLEEKAKRVAVVSAKDAEGNDATAYNGVLALLDDYDRALAPGAFPTE